MRLISCFQKNVIISKEGGTYHPELTSPSDPFDGPQPYARQGFVDRRFGNKHENRHIARGQLHRCPFSSQCQHHRRVERPKTPWSIHGARRCHPGPQRCRASSSISRLHGDRGLCTTKPLQPAPSPPQDHRTQRSFCGRVCSKDYDCHGTARRWTPYESRG